MTAPAADRTGPHVRGCPAQPAVVAWRRARGVAPVTATEGAAVPVSRLSFRLLLAALAAVALLTASVNVAAADAAKRKPRPSAKVVKLVVSEHWDTDGTGPNYTELTFHKVKIGKPRDRHVNERAPADIVTPVTVKFTQTITYGPEPGMRDVTRVTLRALFYKGEFEWTYWQKGAKLKVIERM
jgi:hypothetical protein